MGTQKWIFLVGVYLVYNAETLGGVSKSGARVDCGGGDGRGGRKKKCSVLTLANVFYRNNYIARKHTYD